MKNDRLKVCLGNLELLEVFRDNKILMCKVKCRVCSNDPEMYGDGIYTTRKKSILAGQKPCGCSKNPKYTAIQREILSKRAAEQINAVFLGFDGEYINQYTKAILHCNTCNERWYSCSFSNLLRGRGCPSCANAKRKVSRKKPDETIIETFFKTGVFHKDTRFVRGEGRSWTVSCPVCNTTVTSDKSNLQAGKVPCNCKNGGGFVKSRPSFFYILSAEGYKSDLCGYGVTSYYKKRYNDHKRELGKVNMTIDRFAFIPCSGYNAVDIETLFKQQLPLNSHNVSGFKRESTFYDYFDVLLDFAEEYLEEKAKLLVNDYEGCYKHYEQVL